MAKKEFTAEEARRVGDKIGVDWDEVDPEQFRMGLGVELEHGTRFGRRTDVTGDCPYKTGQIALAHLLEIPTYYSRLKKMEGEAKLERAGENIKKLSLKRQN